MRSLLALGVAVCIAGCAKGAVETTADDDDGESRPRRSTKAEEKLPDGAVITVRDHEVTIDGEAAGTTRPIDELGRLQKIDALFDGLKEKREVFKSKNPDKSFPGQVVLRCDEGASMLAFKSVFQTAAYAGYPHVSVEVNTEAATGFVAVEAQIPQPPGGRITLEPKELHVELGPSTTRVASKRGNITVSETSVLQGASKEAEGALREAIIAELKRHATTDLVLHADKTLRFPQLAAAFRAADGVRVALAEENAHVKITFALSERQGATPAGEDDALPAPSASSAGRLPPEVIQRIVRSNFGKLRACYEAGLLTNPKLEGRVTVKFVIGRDGSVGSVQGTSDLPDVNVKNCVVREFYGFTFPQPEGGIVTVTYPIVFTPSG